MSTMQEHYANLLAQHYTWMFGDRASVLEANADFFDRHQIRPCGSGRAVDLGAGTGFQSIPLAERGFNVTSVDSCPALLTELAASIGDMPIQVVEGDLLDVKRFVAPGLELAVCMGDTLMHLSSVAATAGLFADVFELLESGGRFVLSWRDMTVELHGTARFIPVRADESTIFTCFLEYFPEHVEVHDLVYTNVSGSWQLKASSYPKLRLASGWVQETLRSVGFELETACVERRQNVLIVRKP